MASPGRTNFCPGERAGEELVADTGVGRVGDAEIGDAAAGELRDRPIDRIAALAQPVPAGPSTRREWMESGRMMRSPASAAKSGCAAQDHGTGDGPVLVSL